MPDSLDSSTPPPDEPIISRFRRELTDLISTRSGLKRAPVYWWVGEVMETLIETEGKERIPALKLIGEAMGLTGAGRAEAIPEQKGFRMAGGA